MSSFGLPSLARVSALPSDVIGALRQIPEIAEHTRAIKSHTAALTRVAEQTDVLTQMDARMAAIEEAMPVLVEVQRHLAQLPETMGSLDDGIERLSALMERIMTTLDGLNASVESRQGAVEPMGRLASRMPGQKK
jgi:uncharacterized phage infection (PIP) family protein YhgE